MESRNTRRFEGVFSRLTSLFPSVHASQVLIRNIILLYLQEENV